jgi:hypothetical protein
MWWVKDWGCLMQEELTGCLGVVFSVLVAVAREGSTTRRGRSICSMARLGGSTREQPAHLVTGKHRAPNPSNGREWHRRQRDERAQACRRREATEELGTLLVVCSVVWTCAGLRKA